MPEPDSPAPIPRVRVLIYDLATGEIVQVLTGVPGGHGGGAARKKGRGCSSPTPATAAGAGTRPAGC